MKWINKGHEYDAVYSKIIEKESFYLFGAGDFGNLFYEITDNKVPFIAYIDNDVKKQGTIINGLKCISLNEAKVDSKHAIILTMSQFARVATIEQLKAKGLKRNDDFFIIEEFLSVYFSYKYQKVYMTAISFLPSTICNLNCKNCLNFNPFAKEFFVRKLDDLKHDVDLFFDCVDKIMLFHVSGGEPMLYKHIAELIQYIDENYGDRIGVLRTVTNGTVVPKDEILEVLAKCNVEVTVDDYREAVPRFNDRFDKLISKFDEYGIKYYINKVESWIDLAPDRTDYSDKSEEWLINHRDSCGQSWEELRDGKLYSCNYAAYATVAGIAGEQDTEESYDLNLFTTETRNELIEFRLGYTNKGYTNFCKKCRGFTPENDVAEKPAVQTEVTMEK
ncbi:MAG: radical SAM protein [Pseudobutyrivibrio sp.]|nr:radical SAM protein [Pseudobutyrivibrio sp.]